MGQEDSEDGKTEVIVYKEKDISLPFKKNYDLWKYSNTQDMWYINICRISQYYTELYIEVVLVNANRPNVTVMSSKYTTEFRNHGPEVYAHGYIPLGKRSQYLSVIITTKNKGIAIEDLKIFYYKEAERKKEKKEKKERRKEGRKY